MIPTRPLFCSSLSDTAGRQDISLAASAIWSCLPSALLCRPRLLETVISKHIYYFPLPGLRGARFLLLFDDAGQRQCYFTIWIRAKGAVSVKSMAPEVEQGVPRGCLLAAQAASVRWDPMQLRGCKHSHLFFTLLLVSMLWSTTDVEWIECDCFSLWLVWYYTQIPQVTVLFRSLPASAPSCARRDSQSRRGSCYRDQRTWMFCKALAQHNGRLAQVFQKRLIESTTNRETHLCVCICNIILGVHTLRPSYSLSQGIACSLSTYF